MPFSVLKNLCTDMPGMMGTHLIKSWLIHAPGCGDYNAMCPADTAVEECNMTVLPLGKTMAMQNLISNMCAMMPMAGCSECTTGTIPS